jgi:hypothetical protein
MPKRRKAPKRKAKRRKPVAKKKSAVKKRHSTSVKRKAKSKAKKASAKMTPKKKAGAFNRKSYWKAFKDLEARADAAWKKFQSSVKNKAPQSEIAKNRSDLLLILGECNYMAQECARLQELKKSKKA